MAKVPNRRVTRQRPLNRGSALLEYANRPTVGFPKLVIQEVSHYSADWQAQTDPSIELEYIQPNEITRSEDDPILSQLTGTVVVKTSWPGTDRRSNEADMYRDSAGRFGTIPHVCSYEGAGRHRVVISNNLLVPQAQGDDLVRYHWPIFDSEPPRKPEIRILKFSVFSVKGKSLVEAKSPRQLSRSWAHSLLGMFIGTPPTPSNLFVHTAGWLSLYLSGHLHRDVSLGNTLMTDEPVGMKKFEIPKEFRDHLESLQNKEAVGRINELCSRVEQLVAQLGISDQCTGFVTDGDLAIPWRDYWNNECRAAKLVSYFYAT